MPHTSEATPLPRILIFVAGFCLVAAILVTLLSNVFAQSIGMVGTITALGIMWLIAIAEVVVWCRYASPRSLGVVPFRLIDLGVALAAGIVLMLAVPLLSLGAAALGGYATGTVESAAQLNVALATLGVITAAVTEEVIYRAGAMGALAALAAPKWVVLIVPALIFTATHWAWGFAHTAFVVLPLGLALGALYLWRRNLLVNIVAHLVVDIPLIVIAAASA